MEKVKAYSIAIRNEGNISSVKFQCEARGVSVSSQQNESFEVDILLFWYPIFVYFRVFVFSQSDKLFEDSGLH